MKKVKIGEKEYNRLENLFDINDERFLIFKQYMLQVFENIDKPNFLVMHNKVIKHFNANDNYKIIIELENFKKALEMRDLDYDAYSVCFALIHLDIEEKEDLNDYDTDKQLLKLAEMRKSGLSRGDMEEAVENFMIASPKHFAHYLGMLEVMKTIPKEEISSALQD